MSRNYKKTQRMLGTTPTKTCTLSIKKIEWPRQIHSHGAAKEIPCPMKDFTATVFSWVNEEICMSSFQQGKYCESRFRR